jgi:hypothetical protein
VLKFHPNRIMRIFTCSACNQTVYFENVRCMSCGHALAFLPDLGIVSAIETLPDAPGTYSALAPGAKGRRYRLCANSAEFGVCNSAILADDPESLCPACRLNQVIPDLSTPDALPAWHRLESAKRRLFYTLRELGLPIESRRERKNGLAFSFMQDTKSGEKIFTGHSDGLITINIAEADDPFREKLRKELSEVYRTVLGHFRHEIGHYYWDRLIADSEWLPAFRTLFGDERASYDESLGRHYSEGPPEGWPNNYVSSYATMHPWEDWAETWAHYLHMVDTLGTARAYGLVLQPKPLGGKPTRPLSTRALHFDDFDDLIGGWVPLTVALNSFNRSMGIVDAYPFVLGPAVTKKLNFVHDVIEHFDLNSKGKQKVLARWPVLRDSEPSTAPSETSDEPRIRQEISPAPESSGHAAGSSA